MYYVYNIVIIIIQVTFLKMSSKMVDEKLQVVLASKHNGALSVIVALTLKIYSDK